jgi:Bax protein
MDRLGTAIFRSLEGFVRVAKLDFNDFLSLARARHASTYARQCWENLCGTARRETARVWWRWEEVRCVARRASACARWRWEDLRGTARRASARAWWRTVNSGGGAWHAYMPAAAPQKASFAVLVLGTGIVAALTWTTPPHHGGGGRSPIPAGVQSAAVSAVAGSRAVIEARIKPRRVIVVSASAHDLFKDFRRIGYRLEDVRRGDGAVPRVFVKAMPKDIGKVPSTARRKAVFIKTMLPLVLRTNEELRAIRAKVLALTAREAKGQAMTPVERTWLAAQYDRFGVSRNDSRGLLLRVDVIPPSLAVAQGAEESGWGSSRFALEGQALFGQRTHSNAPGLVPVNRAAGARFKIKSFGHLLEGVRSYAQNLNTHPAYARFRAVRAQMRAEAGGTHGLDAYRLVDALKNYSERGADYLKTIKSIIRVNDLRALDGARLSSALGSVEKQNPV